MTSIKNMTTPDFGGATDVTVIEILVKPGDTIQKDKPVVTLESDKATMELPAAEEGVIKEIKVKVGDKVSTGSVLLTFEEKDTAEKKGAKEKETHTTQSAPAQIEQKQKTQTKNQTKTPTKTQPEDKDAPDLSAKKKETARKKGEQADKQRTEKKESKKLELENIEENENLEAKENEDLEKTSNANPNTEKEQQPLIGTLQSSNNVHAGPSVRRLARELGINLMQVTGSGPKERILKEDVQGFVKNQLSQVQSANTGLAFPALPNINFSKFGEIEITVLSRIKKLSGKNLQRNWMMIPHVTQFAEADITELEDFRHAQKASLEKENVKLTPLVFIMKAVVASLKAFPQFNASLDPSGENLILKKYFHVGVAVDTDDGLVVPVIRDVDKKGMRELAKELAQISNKARKKQLLPADMQGGSFSISSLGGIGGTAFTPIINYPEVAILGVSKATYKPVYQHEKFVPCLMLPLSLSYDHRVIDGALGARFIVHLTAMLADIRNLLM